MARSWTRASAICSVQRMPDHSMRSLIRFLQAPSTGPLVIGQPHAGAVAIDVVGDRVQGFAFGTRQAALGDALTDALDDLADPGHASRAYQCSFSASCPCRSRPLEAVIRPKVPAPTVTFGSLNIGALKTL